MDHSIYFLNYKRHLVGILLTVYKHFGNLATAVFRFCCKFSTKIFFYLPVNNEKPKFVAFLEFYCLYECFIYRSNFVFPKISGKIVNSQGYFEFREPIKTRENYYSLIW